MRTKKIVLPGLALLLLSGLFFSCRRENLAGISTRSDSTALFSASIDGVDWQTDSVSAYLSAEYNGKARIMTITGYTWNRLITISLQDTSSAGSDSTLAIQSYPVGSRGNVSAFGYAYNKIYYGPSLVWQVEGTAVNGQAAVTVSDGVNKLVSGTFSFAAPSLTIDSTGIVKDTVQVTSGVFKNIPYTYFKRP